MAENDNQDPALVDYDEQRLTEITIEKQGNEAQAVNQSNAQENSVQAQTASRENNAAASRGQSQGQDDAAAEQQRNGMYKSMEGKGENVDIREKHEKKLPWVDPFLKDGQSTFFDYPDKPKPSNSKKRGFALSMFDKTPDRDLDI